jgi:hypothetical protein
MKNLITFILTIGITILVSLGIQSFFWALDESTPFRFNNYSLVGWVAQIAYWITCLAIGINIWYEKD